MDEQQHERKKVRIGCRLRNGVVLRIFEKRHDGAADVMQPVRSVELAGRRDNSGGINAPMGEPVFTEVDGDFWEAWVAQHKNTLLFQSGTVFVEQPETP